VVLAGTSIAVGVNELCDHYLGRTAGKIREQSSKLVVVSKHRIRAEQSRFTGSGRLPERNLPLPGVGWYLDCLRASRFLRGWHDGFVNVLVFLARSLSYLKQQNWGNPSTASSNAEGQRTQKVWQPAGPRVCVCAVGMCVVQGLVWRCSRGPQKRRP
jgi:hypothetical protein